MRGDRGGRPVGKHAATKKKPKRLKAAITSIACLCVAAGLAAAATLNASASGMNLTPDSYNKIISEKHYAISPGVEESTYILNDETGSNQNFGYVLEVDLSNEYATVMPSYKNMDPNTWGTEVMSKQAASAEEKLGVNVVGGTNVNLSWASDEPIGMLVIDGEVYHEDTSYSGSYLVIYKDNTAELRDGNVPLDGTEWQALTVNFGWLVKDGVNQYPAEDHATGNRAPRTAIGIKEDGSLVMFVVDGRQAPTSVGMTMNELATTMAELGCVQAVNCDGGGSSTFLSEREGTGELTVKNSPSDGVERPTLCGLLVVSTATPTGIFDHASITPDSELYTPGTEIQFNASGVDSTGAAVALPEGLEWVLDDDSKDLGTIDSATGLFVANSDAVGVVSVSLKSGDEVVGEASVELVEPDAISFASEEISLGFEDTTDFGVSVRYNGLDVNYKTGDIVWTIDNEKLGTFDGDIFTSSDGESLNGYVTATSAFNPEVSNTIHLIVGMLPTVVWDFEDYTDPETGEVISAEEYYIKHTVTDDEGNAVTEGLLSTSNYGRGGNESIEIVSIDDDEPVRMGSHSLKLNYDFTECGAVTEGACIGTTEGMEIPGAPTAIGVWVYAPEGTGIQWDGEGDSGFWLRGYYIDSTGSTQQYNFTFEPKNFTGDSSTWPDEYPGIWWEGWKYCEAELNGNAPYSVQSGMTFRLMYVYGTKMGTKTSGSIYFDNLQFVYGTNVDDVDNPVIGGIQADNTELEDGAVLASNEVDFSADYYDVENKYTTGIDADTTRLYVDGVNAKEDDAFNFAADPDGSKSYLYGVKLLNGQHSITASVRDKFGNETSETRYFTVDSEDALAVPSVSVKPKEESAVLGETVNLEIRATDASAVSSNKTEIKLSNLFPDYEVTFADDYEGTVSYNKMTRVITVDASRKAEATGSDNLIGTISVKVPTTLKSDSLFAYTVKSGRYVTSEGVFTYSASEATLPVTASYSIAAEPIIVGTSGTLVVTKADGTPAAGVGVYLEDGTLLGESDENGELATNHFGSAAGKYTVYAQDSDGKISFLYTVSSYDSVEGITAPYGIMCNIAADAQTQKNITWLSNSNQTANQQIQYSADGENWTTIQAKTELRTFTTGGNVAIYANGVTLTDLTPGTTYQYRVGGDDVWSDVYSFTTDESDGQAKFFVFGDVQADDLTKVTALMNSLKEEGFDFGIQTGDAVDDASNYYDWVDIISLFGAENLDDTNMIHVLGNHEYAGDGNASNAKAFYNLPASDMGSHYSVTYDDVYVAVINYTGTKAQLETALDWLRQDAASSEATWKILTMHQPAYYTNVSGGNAEVNALVPAVVDEAGIDLVFSGHDHTYARTAPMTGGVVDSNGATYFICGSSGEKSYSVTDNEAFNFEIATQDYSAIYLTVEADADKIAVTTYDVAPDGTQRVFDSYTKYVPRCPNDEHAYIYSRVDDGLYCTECEYECNASDTYYSGWATDSESGAKLYFAGGKYQTDYQFIQSTTYYFAEDGSAVEGERTICGKTCVFESGRFVSCEDASVVSAGFCGDSTEFLVDSSNKPPVIANGKIEVRALSDAIQVVTPWQNYKTTIESISIGNGITEIPDKTFNVYSALKTVDFEEGSNLEVIGGSAFADCANLTEIVLPDSVKSINGNAFLGCRNLASVYLPDDVERISNLAFDKRYGVVLSVGYDSYAKHWADENSVLYVERDPFIVSGECGDDLTWKLVGSDLFVEGSGKMSEYAAAGDVPWSPYAQIIKTVTVAPGVSTISDYAFSGCSILKEVNFAEGSMLKSVGGSAFADCASLTEIVLPDSVKSINGNAFLGCRNLASVYLPDDVERISNLAFDKRYGVVLSVGYDSYAKHWADENSVLYVERNAPESIVLSETSKNVTIEDEPFQLIATVVPENEAHVVVWSSSDENVAVVDSDGNVTIKGVGAAVITASCGNVSANCELVVDSAQQELPGTGGETPGDDLTIVERLDGEKSDETSAVISAEAFESSQYVVIARDDDFADAMSATGLAGTLECPIVLTDRYGLSAVAAEEIARLGATEAYIIGGPGAMPGDFESELGGMGFSSVERIYGNESWDTSVECAANIIALGGNTETSIVATSLSFQDAISISSFAYKYKVPIYLQTQSGDRPLPDAAVEKIKEAGGDIYVPGGPGAVKEKTVEGVFDGRNVIRLYGDDAYDTSNQIATYMVENGLLSSNAVTIACGAEAAKGTDALAGSALAGKNNGVMLLVNANERMEAVHVETIEGEDSEKKNAFLATYADQVSKVYVLGGPYVIPEEFVEMVKGLLS